MLFTNFTKNRRLVTLFVFLIITLIGFYFFSNIIEKFYENNEDNEDNETTSYSKEKNYNPLIIPESTEEAAASIYVV